MTKLNVRLQAVGRVSIFYDDDVEGYRLLFDAANGDQLMNHVIVRVCTVEKQNPLFSYHLYVVP